LGATGGVISLLTSDKPILESPHAVTGLIGLTLLAAQTSLPILFELRHSSTTLAESTNKLT
nr:di-heme cytochrome, transmembrane [Tanacetum cinerariifolium]